MSTVNFDKFKWACYKLERPRDCESTIPLATFREGQEAEAELLAAVLRPIAADTHSVVVKRYSGWVSDDSSYHHTQYNAIHLDAVPISWGPAAVGVTVVPPWKYTVIAVRHERDVHHNGAKLHVRRTFGDSVVIIRGDDAGVSDDTAMLISTEMWTRFTRDGPDGFEGVWFGPTGDYKLYNNGTKVPRVWDTIPNAYGGCVVYNNKTQDPQFVDAITKLFRDTQYYVRATDRTIYCIDRSVPLTSRIHKYVRGIESWPVEALRIAAEITAGATPMATKKLELIRTLLRDIDCSDDNDMSRAELKAMHLDPSEFTWSQ